MKPDILQSNLVALTENGQSRRQFLKLTGLAGAAVLTHAAPFSAVAAPRRKQSSEPLNIALIGVQGRAANTIRDFLLLDENIVALCDVDLTRLEKGAALAGSRFPNARRYQDYRKLFETEKDLDAVVVTTPDHMHAPISLLAMSRGLHVFCEKPLTRTVWEARQMRDMARKSGVVTQMGNQGSAAPSLRRAVEVIQAGVLGSVREVHVWTDRISRINPKASDARRAPANLDWDIWLGVAGEEPFNPQVHPAYWRWWKNFGGGALGDMACHLMNMPFRALDLSDPSAVDVEVSEALRPGMFPTSSKVIYDFPKRDKRGALKLTWYDGGKKPDKQLIESLGIIEDFEKAQPNANLVIGEKGVLYDDAFLKLNGEKEFTHISQHAACASIPETIPRAKHSGTSGHYREWAEACKGIGSTYSSFDIAAALTEMVQIGAVAVKLGRKIRWDAEQMRVIGEPAADALLRPAYRPGFTVAEF